MKFNISLMVAVFVISQQASAITNLKFICQNVSKQSQMIINDELVIGEEKYRLISFTNLKGVDGSSNFASDDNKTVIKVTMDSGIISEKLTAYTIDINGILSTSSNDNAFVSHVKYDNNCKQLKN